MEAAAPGCIGRTAPLALIGYSASNGSRDDLTGILCLHFRIAAGGKRPIHSRFGVTHDVVISHRSTDTGAAGDAKPAGQIDIHGVISSRYSGIFICSDHRTSDARLRVIVDAVHAYRSINGHRFCHATGGGNSDIGGFRLCVYYHIFPTSHSGAIIDVGLGAILLTHRQGRAAKTGLRRIGHGPVVFIEKILLIFKKGFCTGTHKKIRRIFMEEIRHTACEIHGSDIGLRLHIHIAAGLYLRRCRLLVVFLSDIGLCRIVIVHHRDGRCAGCIFRDTLSLGPAIHQVGKTQIGR